MMGFNSRIEGLECVEGHFEHFLPSPAVALAAAAASEAALKADEEEPGRGAPGAEEALGRGSEGVGRPRVRLVPRPYGRA